MKPLRGPAHPINVYCPRCRQLPNHPCPGWKGDACPEREKANHKRLNMLRDEAREAAEDFRLGRSMVEDR